MIYVYLVFIPDQARYCRVFDTYESATGYKIDLGRMGEFALISKIEYHQE